MNAAPYPAAFVAIIDIVLGHEGGLSLVASDPGNWTGGAVGVGQMRGTNWGLSAAAFPTLNIRSITREQAIGIYFALYWQKAACSAVPAPLALLVMDAAVNNGVGRAVRWLQAACGAVPDGLFGTASLRALTAALASPTGLASVCTEFQSQRLVFMAALATWRVFGLGWARRLIRLAFQAPTLAAG